MTVDLKVMAGLTAPIKDETNPFAEFLDYDLDNPPTASFLLDQLICDKITLIAGSPGVGKTTQLVPLFTKVAHLCAADDPMKPEVRRRVVYFSEDPDQVVKILHAMYLDGQLGDASKAEIKDWFRIISARRLQSHEFIERKEFMATLANEVTYQGVTYQDMPLLVFDTSSASFEMEDENSNSAVSAVLSTIKSELGGVPTVIVTHIAKALKRVEAGMMSSRGAGSWEGDVAQVCYLTMEDENDEQCKSRWLEIAKGKHRFTTKYEGIVFEGQLFDYQTTDRMGHAKTEHVMYALPRAVTRDEKSAMAAERHEEVAQRRNDDLRGKILDLAEKQLQPPESPSPLTRSRLVELVKGRRQTAVEVINELIDERWLQVIDVPLELRLNNMQKQIILRVNERDRRRWIEDGEIPHRLEELPPIWFKQDAGPS